MFLRELPRALLRRWYLLLVGLAIAATGAYLAWDRIEPTYSAESSILMLPPTSATKAVPPNTTNSNPLLYLGGLGQARDALISALASDASKKDFEAKFPDTEYEIVPDNSSNAPIIVMSAEAPTAETALTAVKYLADRVDGEFSNLQRQLAVDKEEQIRSMPLTTATLAAPNYQTRIRTAAIVGVGLAAISVLLVGLVDGLLIHRRKGLVAKRAYQEDEGPSGRDSAPADEPPVADNTETELTPEEVEPHEADELAEHARRINGEVPEEPDPAVPDDSDESGEDAADVTISTVANDPDRPAEESTTEEGQSAPATRPAEETPQLQPHTPIATLAGSDDRHIKA